METKSFLKNSKIDWIGYSYAGMVLTGGIMGYVKARSVMSLASGILFGSLLTYGAYLTSHRPSNYYLILGTSLTLAALMGQRFYKSGKIMPAGLIFGISALMAIRYGLRYINESR